MIVAATMTFTHTNNCQLFSALYSMLPSAKSSLVKGGFSSKAAAWILIGCFLGGAVGIQLLSRILHRFVPSHVVDCEHTHDDEEDAEEPGTKPHEHQSHGNHHGSHQHEETENRRPLLPSGTQSHSTFFNKSAQPLFTSPADNEQYNADLHPAKRPSLHSRLSKKISSITSKNKPSCDCDGPCYGFSEPCGQDCFKVVQARGGSRMASSRSLRRSDTGRSFAQSTDEQTETTPLLGEIREDTPLSRHLSDSAIDRVKNGDEEQDSAVTSDTPTLLENGHAMSRTKSAVSHAETEHSQHPGQHHHHVPKNAFLSIGLQTSIAIALHKLPEGFITYATNHANPKLGFAVFLALFIHNITEGFAMALPLYLAINSRWKAMFWSSLLGGFSQPLGAGVAAIWFKLAGSGDMAPGEGVYGGMFAITAGIMASVALQLFSESLDLTHSRGLCMIFAFVGMGILGFSSALTA